MGNLNTGYFRGAHPSRLVPHPSHLSAPPFPSGAHPSHLGAPSSSRSLRQGGVFDFLSCDPESKSVPHPSRLGFVREGGVFDFLSCDPESKSVPHPSRVLCGRMGILISYP